MTKDLFVKDVTLFGLGPAINPSPSIADQENITRQVAISHGRALTRAFNPATLKYSDCLNLVIFGNGIVAYEALNLVLFGKGQDASSTYLDLFLCNNYIESSGLPLYVSGDGVNEGYVYVRYDLNLYLERPTSNVLDLTLIGPGQPLSSNNLDLYLGGVQSILGVLNLVLGSNSGSSSGQLDLYIHGF